MLPGVGEEGVLRDLAGVLGVHGAPRFRRHLLAHVAMASAPLAQLLARAKSTKKRRVGARAPCAPVTPSPPTRRSLQKKRAAAMTIHSSFYASQLACLLVWSGLVRVMTGRHLHALCAGAVLTRPPWLSARWLLLLDKHRSSVFAALPVVLAVAAVWPSSWPVRLIAAVAVSLYHLLESSGTNRHGEYPLLYNALGMLLPADHAHAFALGVAIHFVLSSGVAKLQYGGRAWLEEGTMRVYLDVYRSSSSGPPLSRALSQWLSRRAWATRTIARATVLLECVLVPAALLLPPAWRPLCCWAMALMHVGIALAMSLRVGVVFLTTLPGYVLGFSCAAPLLSPAWLLALAVGALPTALALARGAPLPEAWPLSPISLFMWSGEQARVSPSGRRLDEPSLRPPRPTAHLRAR